MAFLIADGLVLAVLLIFACIGARRGLILSLCGLLAFVVAFLGASFAARTLSPRGGRRPGAPVRRRH